MQNIDTSSLIRIGAEAKTDNADTPDVDETADAVVVSVCIDLNGHNITNKSRAFSVYSGSTLNLMNTGDTESVVTGSYNRDAAGVISLTKGSNMNLYSNVKLVGAAAVTEDTPNGFKYAGGVISVSDGSFTMHGGTIVGQHATKGGAIAANSSDVTIAGGTVYGSTATQGGAVYVNGGSLIVTGGLITGGTATDESANPFGGNIYVEGAEFAMTGGKVTNGTAVSTAKTPGGGNIYLRAASASLNISGGMIENGTASNGNGGNIYLNVGTLNVFGDVQINGGNATRGVARTNGGGNIYTAADTTLHISGGRITNGTTNSYGGNVVIRGTGLISDGVISGGSALNGGNIFVNGYDRAVTLSVTGGTIENGTATTGKIDRTDMVKPAYDGDNIYVNSAVLNIVGGVISDDDGGNAVLGYTHPNSVKDGKTFGTVVNLELADKADLADMLDGKIYLISGATLNADIGGTATDADGDMIWYKVAPSVEPTDPEETTVPSQPEETTVPSQPEETTVPSQPEETTVPSQPEETTTPTQPEAETCPHCGEEVSKITYKEWSVGSGEIATESGHFYLPETVTGISGQIKIGDTGTPADVFLDLRGNNFEATNVRIFSISAGSTLTLVDTVGGGELQGGGNGGNVINMAAGATFNLYDATLTNVRATESTSMGGVVNTTDGTAETPAVFNMYSGVLNGGNHAGNGGAVCVRKYAEFNMYGGVVNGATCTTEGKTPVGAAIAVRANTSVIHIYDGTVVGGVSEGVGDCIHAAAGATVIVEGGMFIGGDVYLKTEGEDAIVLSGTVEFEKLDLTSGGIITLGKGGITGTVKVNGVEGVICAAGEDTEKSLTCFQSLNADLEPSLNGEGQIVLATKTQVTRSIVKPFSIKASRRLFA